ncbi:hypothetical protein J8J40_21615, partial [Mycobacterium tuberculosis]|nr:hypothetical protein [Mycobacterium tuberculosis]
MKDHEMSNRMWGGRFSVGPATIMEEINASIGFDQKLAPQDIAGSRAHAAMLAAQGIISADDQAAIDRGLETIAAEIEAEARDNVARLMPHPSLVLWNGNNENIWGYVAWGWQSELQGRSWGARYYFELLPKIVAETDPTRPYWPGSPYS